MRDEGFSCYVYDVIATTIHNGVLVEGRSSLGGSWYREDDTSECAQEIGGYLPQMIDEALEEMDAQLPKPAGKRKAR
jgi:hypothetical protein